MLALRRKQKKKIKQVKFNHFPGSVMIQTIYIRHYINFILFIINDGFLSVRASFFVHFSLCSLRCHYSQLGFSFKGFFFSLNVQLSMMFRFDVSVNECSFPTVFIFSRTHTQRAQLRACFFFSFFCKNYLIFLKFFFFWAPL